MLFKRGGRGLGGISSKLRNLAHGFELKALVNAVTRRPRIS